MSDPLVSIVIPTHNRRHMLERAVRSVLEQTVKDIEVIVVDDASEDDTPAFLEDLGSERIRGVTLPRNAGACHARNVGIDLCRGRYVAFLDSDDTWYPDKLERQITTLERSDLGDAHVVNCGARFYDDDLFRHEWMPTHRGAVLHHLLDQRKVGVRPPYLLVRRALLMANNLRFDPALCARQDLDFALQLFQYSQLEVVREPLVRVNNHSGPRVWTSERAVDASRYILDKHAALFQDHPGSEAMLRYKVAQLLLAQGRVEEARRECAAARPAARGPWWLLWDLLVWSHRTSSLPMSLRKALTSVAVRATF